jgi:hypothetical protein
MINNLDGGALLIKWKGLFKLNLLVKAPIGVKNDLKYGVTPH